MVFKDKTEMHRAKFVLYDSVKSLKKSGKVEGRLAEALVNCEIIVDREAGPDGTYGFVIRHRENNPFYAKMLGMIEGLGQAPPVVDSEEQAAEESLKKLMERMQGEPGLVEAAAAEPGKGNPYYNRGEL